MVKFVNGSPLQIDLSANFLINEKFTLGAAYRFDAAVSALVGFQVTDGIFIGGAYDYDTTILNDYNNGSYEIILNFNILNKSLNTISPRFF